MASPTAAELARQLELKLNDLTKEVNLLSKQVEVLKLVEVRERLSMVEGRLSELAKAFEQLKPTEAKSEEMGALKNRLTQLEEQKKLGDTRAFQFIVLFIGGLLTLAINIALLFLKK